MAKIKARDYTVFTVIDMAKKKSMGVTLDLDPRVTEYYRRIAKDEGRKVFYFTDKTMQRVENMDISKLKPEEILSICHKGANTTGVVLASENHRRLCFGYTIGENQIILCGYISSKSSMHSDNPDSVIKTLWLGNIIISESDIEIKPYTLWAGISQMVSGANVRFDKMDAIPLRKILREVQKYPDAFQDESKPGMITFNPVKLATDTRVPVSQGEAVSHNYKAEKLITVLKMFLFLKTASVIDQTYISDGYNSTYRRASRELRNYIQVDSTWDGDITVLNPFSVRGHFRHQNKKDEKGEWYKELIYIDAFMKKGYHRRATKVISDEMA